MVTHKMPKIGQIPNRTVTSLGIDKEKLAECKKRNINLSLFVDEALTREFEPQYKDAYLKAIELQNQTFKRFIEKSNQQEAIDYFKYEKGGEDVVEKESQRKIRQTAHSFRGV